MTSEVDSEVASEVDSDEREATSEEREAASDGFEVVLKLREETKNERVTQNSYSNTNHISQFSNNLSQNQISNFRAEEDGEGGL